MSIMSRLRESLRSTAGKVTLAGMIGAGALFGAGRPANAQSIPSPTTTEAHEYYVPAAAHGALAQVHRHLGASAANASSPLTATELAANQPFSTYYVASSAHLNGAFQSFWKTYLGGRNAEPLSGLPTTLTIIAHPRGVPGQPTDPSMDYGVQPAASFDFDDLLGTMGYTGAAWLEIQSSATDLELETSVTYNHSPNGEKQGAGYPIFDKATITTDPRLAHRGDRVDFRLRGNESNFRENYLAFVPPESNGVHLTFEMYDSNWGLRGTAQADVPAGAYLQWSTLGVLFGDSNFANPGDTLRVTIDKTGGGDGDAFAYSVVSQVQTLNPQYQDGTNLEGTIDRLLSDVNFTFAPTQLEVNDPLGQVIEAIARPGAIITDVYEDNEGDGVFDNHYTPNANSVSLNINGSPVAAGTYHPKARFFINDNGIPYTKDVDGPTVTVTEEKNGYIATYADAKTFIMGNLDLVSKWASYGTIDGQTYSPAQWRTWWQESFDGVPGNGEVDHLVFNDVGNELNGNLLQIVYKSNPMTPLYGLPEQVFDQFRNAVNAKIPQ